MKENVTENGSHETLDPANWEQVKKLGTTMLEDMIGYLQEIRQQPVWQPVPGDVRTYFEQPLPESPQSQEAVYAAFRKYILPYNIGNVHPKFWGWVMGTGSVQGMLADMLAAGMNSCVGIGDQAPMYADRQVISWCKEMMGFPPESSGTLVAGASAANLNALIVARNAAGSYIREKGLPSRGYTMVLYASAETHSSVQKAAEIIGIGSENVRKIRTDNHFRLDPAHLEAAIIEDLAGGQLPFCVVANAGTVNTGAIDPLKDIHAICEKYNLWFHVDGAFGALAKLLPEFGEELQYIEKADSLAFDLHKWMYMPYEAGVVLVRDARLHRSSFALQPEYIAHQEGGIAAGPELVSNFGFDLSRNFKALKVWMGLLEHGIGKFRRLIRQNIRQAQYLRNLVLRHFDLELMAPVSLNIVCFRYKPCKDEKVLDELNQALLEQLQERGIAAPSYTRINGKYCLRVAISNHRSEQKDFDELIGQALTIGAELFEKRNGVYFLIQEKNAS